MYRVIQEKLLTARKDFEVTKENPAAVVSQYVAPLNNYCLFRSGFRNWSHITTHLVDVLVIVCRPSSKKPKAMSELDEILKDYSSSKYASIDWVRFLIWRHNFKMAAMTSFYAEKLCHLAIAGQFLIYRTFVLVFFIIPAHWSIWVLYVMFSYRLSVNRLLLY